ncbi:MAG: O-antigen ligase family protein [Longimicrobiaceae bacterium]
MTFVLALLAAVALPAWASLVIVVPLLMTLSFSGTLLPLQSTGGNDLQAYDVVTIVAAFKLASAVLLRGGTLVLHRVHAALLLFLGVLTAATILAQLRFGTAFFRAELTPLLRFAMQAVALAFFLPQALQERQFPLLRRTLDVLGYLMALPIFVGILFLGTGLNVGEVHGVRTFGFVGDQVGFVLALYVLWHLIARNYLRAMFFALAILATGTRGALLAVLVGVLVVAIQRRRLGGRRVRLRTVVGVPLALLAVMFATDLGGTRTRLTGRSVGRGSNVHQRLLTQRLGVELFAENPLVGVGYTGYRLRVIEQGAIARFVRELGFYVPNVTSNAGNQIVQTAADAGVPGLAALGLLFFQLLRALQAAAREADPATAELLFAAYFWLWGLIVGNQGAAWLLPGSFISYLLWVCAAVAVVTLRARRVPAAAPAAPRPSLQPAGAG